MAELQGRVSSVTVLELRLQAPHGCQADVPDQESRLAGRNRKRPGACGEPRSKLDRLVFSDRLAEAGLILIGEARGIDNEFKRSATIRNGLMLTVLALCPMRLKNFAGLELETTFQKFEGCWWITIPKSETKTKRTPRRTAAARRLLSR